MSKSFKGASLSPSGLSDAYLILYNVAQLGGWLAVSVLVIHHLVSTDGDYTSVFGAVGGLINIVQATTGMEAKEHIGCVMMVAAWAFFDVVRYSLYTFTLLKQTPYAILWARYTLFIVFYPVGFSGELLQIVHAIPQVRQSHLFSFSLPNTANVSFDFSYFLIFYLACAVPLFFYMYTHMLNQRKKHLLGKVKAS